MHIKLNGFIFVLTKQINNMKAPNTNKIVIESAGSEYTINSFINRKADQFNFCGNVQAWYKTYKFKFVK